jgi:DNA-binding response OmpR family regulator
VTEPRPVRLLLVEDDRGIADPLQRTLVAQGYGVETVPTAAEALTSATRTAPDLVLLDLGLPDLDGVVLCRELRRLLPAAVIVILTARDAEVDVVVGLEAGADDYLVKPFRLTELLARLRAHLRRESQGGAAAGELAGDRDAPAVIEAGPVRLDRAARTCRIGGRAVELRPKEFELLSVLVERAGQAVSREELMSRVWDENWYGSTKTLDMHIAMLRRRLAELAGDHDRITTLRGFGYRYEADGEPLAGSATANNGADRGEWR